MKASSFFISTSCKTLLSSPKEALSWRMMNRSQSPDRATKRPRLGWLIKQKQTGFPSLARDLKRPKKAQSKGAAPRIPERSISADRSSAVTAFYTPVPEVHRALEAQHNATMQVLDRLRTIMLRKDSTWKTISARLHRARNNQSLGQVETQIP